jgi:poly(3-hydroxybutyrate) depolymerase
VIVEPDQKLNTAPHLFDIYRSTSADKAIVFLHGAGGTKHFFAHQLGINLSDVESSYDTVNEQVILENKILAVFPQGQALPQSPGAYTWSNYVMTSGQNDLQFIKDLVGYIAARYQINTFYIVGHSNGGMMANRIWCESPELFEGYVAVAGPPSERFLAPQTPCSPAEVKPYLGIVGSADNVLQVTGNWDASTWTINPLLIAPPLPVSAEIVDPVLAGERYFLTTRVAQRCGASVKYGDEDAVVEGSLTRWSFCNNSIELLRVESAGHTLESLEARAGRSILDLVLDYLRQQQA